ncbi:hypothetical protein [Saccharothrix obliqua]|uniref:hypothetical protein n=1 Tax=Saccharothrix obliqua TaxID=2861747 RepID=UPI001C5EC40D|nr:hypothetical protein [Saccharothrix obliqua]MBW4721887.1 hypothetical protein [Saccharothrix obliqua]
MGNLRRTTALLAAVAAVQIGVTPVSGAAPPADTRFTRLDTDAAGNPESARERMFIDLSGNGRYALFAVRTNSNMVPEQYRTNRELGYFLVRKDVRASGTTLVSRKEDGSPLRADWRHSAIGWDGTTFAYSTGESGLDPAERGALFHHDLRSGVRRIATMPDRWFYETVDLSADGRWLTWAGLGERGHDNLIHRHDLVGNRTTTLLACDIDPASCRRTGGAVVSDDGGKLVFHYQADDSEASRPTLLDATTGELRTLPAGGSYRISGDGAWLFYVTRADNYRFQLHRVSTAPGSTPVTLRTWAEDSQTWTARVVSANRSGSVIGHDRLGRAQDAFADSHAFVLDQSTGAEITLPEPRPGTAFVTSPTVSGDSRLVVVEERCPWQTHCGPTGVYAISLDGLLPGRG